MRMTRTPCDDTEVKFPSNVLYMEIDVSDFRASLYEGKLELHIPSVETAPMLNEEWVSQVRAGGITDADLDEVVAVMLRELRARQLARIFAERMG